MPKAPDIGGDPARVPAPSLLEVVLGSVNIMQARITRSRMARDPPEVKIAPQLAHLGLMDFYRAEERYCRGAACGGEDAAVFAAVGVGVGVGAGRVLSSIRDSDTGGMF